VCVGWPVSRRLWAHWWIFEFVGLLVKGSGLIGVFCVCWPLSKRLWDDWWIFVIRWPVSRRLWDHWWIFEFVGFLIKGSGLTCGFLCLLARLVVLQHVQAEC
jgi:hypothetical protein